MGLLDKLTKDGSVLSGLDGGQPLHHMMVLHNMSKV
jgi:hypothetical protein